MAAHHAAHADNDGIGRLCFHHFIIRVADSLFQLLRFDSAGNGDILILQTGHGALHAGYRHAGPLHRCGTVAAHHASHTNDDGRNFRLFHLLRLRCRDAFRRTGNLFCSPGGPEQTQPQSIGYYKDGTHAHGGGTQHGTQGDSKGNYQRSCRHGNTQCIVKEGPEQVLPDISDCGFAQFDGTANPPKRAVHQHNVRRLHGDVRARTDGNAHVRGDQGRSIVDAVAHHGHTPSLLLQLLHSLSLVSRQHIRNDPGDSGGFRNGSGGTGIVAGEHNHLESQLLHRLHRCPGVGLQYVCRGNGAEIFFPVIGKVEGCLSLGCQLGKLRNCNAQLLHQPPVSAKITHRPQVSCYTPTRKCLKFRNLLSIFPGFFQDGPGEGMLGFFLQSRRQIQQFLFIQFSRQNVRHRRFSGGEGSCLVQHHGIHMVKIFQCFGILEQYAHLSAPACAHHDGHGRSQAQSAGAGNHQNRNSTVQRMLQAVACNHPDAEGQRRDSHNHRYKNPCDFVCQPGNGCLGTAGLLHHPDHLGQSGILAHLFRTEFQISLHIDGGSRQGIPGHLLHRNAFPGEGALIHTAAAFNHNTIHGNGTAGTNNHDVSHPNFLRGNLL